MLQDKFIVSCTAVQIISVQIITKVLIPLAFRNGIASVVEFIPANSPCHSIAKQSLILDKFDL